jgi:hypothetical protein
MARNRVCVARTADSYIGADVPPASRRPLWQMFVHLLWTFGQ